MGTVGPGPLSRNRSTPSRPSTASKTAAVAARSLGRCSRRRSPRAGSGAGRPGGRSFRRKGAEMSSPVDDDGDVLGRLVLAGNCSSLALECQAEVPILPACELNQPATQRAEVRILQAFAAADEQQGVEGRDRLLHELGACVSEDLLVRVDAEHDGLGVFPMTMEVEDSLLHPYGAPARCERRLSTSPARGRSPLRSASRSSSWRSARRGR